MKLKAEDFKVPTLGEREYKSPLRLASSLGTGIGSFLPDGARTRYQVELFPGEPVHDDILFEKAGPRELLYFDPSETKAAIVTCGGLCPGLNNVIRSLVLALYHNYGVRDLYGIRYGFCGFNPKTEHPPIRLSTSVVENIHNLGGTVLGSSRGPEDPAVIVDYLQRERINILFCIGGDGTQRGSHAIYQETQRRGYPVAVVGIPKTIDNDIPFVWKTFGFNTSIEKAREVIQTAHVEARGAINGIGLVKLMGRDAGFIAAQATLASQEVNFTLIPEIPFELEGEYGFLYHLRRRILSRGHAVIVVAEGAGQDLIPTTSVVKDASGNIKQKDIGIFLREQIKTYFADHQIPFNMRYFDPSYHIRSIPANCDDSVLCDQLARHAVHAAMAGKTDVLVGYWYSTFTYLPISLVVGSQKRVSPESHLWTSVLAVTGQPNRFINPK